MSRATANTTDSGSDYKTTADHYSGMPHEGDALRIRLHDKYRTVLQSKLTLVAAPAGYGKTRLIQSWFNEFEKLPGIQADWVNAERLTYKTGQHFEQFSAALHLPIKKTAFKKNGTSRIDDNEANGVIADAIMATLGSLQARVIVLDNFDALKDESIKRHFFSLVQRIEGPVHFVLSTESSSLADFLELKTRSSLFELTSNDLAFTLSETIEYLAEAGFNEKQGEEVYKITEGWPLGVRFASKVTPYKIEGVTTLKFDGSNRDVDDFFTAYLSNRLPKGTIKLLIEVSMVDTFCAELFEEITGISDARSLLFELENKMTYLVPLDYERKWYRFNNLLLSWLRNKLPQRFSDNHVRDLAHRASAWYHNAGLPVEAAKYAIVAADIPIITKLVGNTLASSKTKEDTAMYDLIDLISYDTCTETMEFCLFAAWAYIHQGRPDDALYWMDQFQKDVGSQSSDKESLKSYELTAEIISAICITLQHNYDEGVPKLERIYREHENSFDPSIKSLLAHTLAEALERLGDFDAARERHTDSLTFGEYCGPSQVRLYGLYELGSVELLQGNLTEALTVFEYGLRESQLDTIRGAFLNSAARVHMEWMHIKEVRENLEKSTIFFSEDRNIDLLLESAITRTEFQLMQGKTFEASATIIEAIRIAEKKTAPRHIGLFLEVERGRVALARNHVSEVKRVIDRLKSRVGSQDVLYQLEAGILQAEVYKAEAQYAKSLELLRELEPLAIEKKLVGLVIRVQILQALVAEKQGLTEEAMTMLGKALEQGAPQGFIKGFYDGGPAIRQLLQEMHRLHKTTRFSRVYIQNLLQSFDAFSGTASDHKDDQVFNQTIGEVALLTSREKEVLKLLGYGMSKKEIAKSLFITINTAKTHVSSIYSKLGVHTSEELFKLINPDSLGER